MRVAHLMHQSRLGSERLLVRLLSRIDRERVDPLVVLATDGPLRAELEALRVPVRIAPMRWWIPATNWTAEHFLRQLEGLGERAERLADLLEVEGVDVVHTQFIVTLEGALAAARLGLSHVWHSRGPFGDGFPPPWFGDPRWLFSVVDRLADAVPCMTRWMAEQMAPECPPGKTRVVYDGLDFAALEPAGAPVRRRHGIDESARLVVTVGGIQRRKGQLDLVEAAPPLVEEFPDLVFVLVGRSSDAEYLARLIGRIDELGLAARFRLVEFEPDLADLLATAEVYAHPSHAEGFSLAVLEAMAAGLPVVAARSGGPEEIVEHGVSGLLVPVESPTELAAAVRRLLADPAAARAMGRAASARARTFSLERTARETEALYRELLVASASRSELAASRAPVAAAVTEELLDRLRSIAAEACGPPTAPA